MFHIDRTDYIPAGKQTCSFCKRPLTSRVAFILRDQHGKEHLCGPTCLEVRANVDRNASVYPDFTKVCSAAPSEGDGRTKSRQKKIGYLEVEYLVLRYRKLQEFPGMRTKNLDPLYERYVKGTLTEEDLRHLSALIRRVRADRPEYSPENLTACYSFIYWIKAAMLEIPGERHDFLKKMLMQIYKKMWLSPAQAEAVNKWLANVEGAPTLDAHAFRAAGTGTAAQS